MYQLWHEKLVHIAYHMLHDIESRESLLEAPQDLFVPDEHKEKFKICMTGKTKKIFIKGKTQINTTKESLSLYVNTFADR